MFFEEGGPERGVVQVCVEGAEEVGVQQHFAAFETLEGAVGLGGGYGVVYPAGGDVE